ncbi:MAG: hypothetical protein IJR98_04710 [Synergistaceae bacterium]|nr:hypothetical protein [Synergistaceae bacterium]
MLGMIGLLITWGLVAAITAAEIGAIVGTYRFFARFVYDVMNSAMSKLKGFMNTLMKADEKKVFAGVKAFIKKVWNGVNTVAQEIVKEYTYFRDKQRWTVTERVREVPPDKVAEEIPLAFIRAVEFNNEHDVTDQVKMKLENCA